MEGGGFDGMGWEFGGGGDDSHRGREGVCVEVFF